MRIWTNSVASRVHHVSLENRIIRQAWTLVCIVLAIMIPSVFSAGAANAQTSEQSVAKTGWQWNAKGDPYLIYPVQGCSYPPVLESFSTLLAQRDTVWVGTFVDVQPTFAVLHVERVLRGDLRQAGVTLRVQWSIEDVQCVHQFQQGERWIYGGPLLQDPSVKIPEGANVATIVSKDLTDRSTCTSNQECKMVSYGCDHLVATHVRNDLAMRRKTQSLFGNPALLQCPVVQPAPARWPVCEPTTNTCSIVTIQ